ncbi:MAG: adenosylcobalamin-dependent ribonucleoside-diphosphate reductase [Deltaproteobacteria bacterium]|nr:adenosylcobalamin-dependent ribonucleoside-diphosphate reductase [Deltaproteobacteria bacterium]MBW1952389.1 adenosylcobalamin-dependent ribonucleoside-diphosphate reductase [Deltaproteobacteria bacterium]MBW1985900.1 adenosylcobalamin-dependent ribonucleoside-diphosphate reductase [Deltaproteobacteria bacterium]MBW2133660.1 adenosylcobalamin-dependent ribonucleoside-diphosphate reductase [Deltaproteobacteria bacterium]
MEKERRSDFSPIARRVLEQRYLRRAEDGRILETPEGLFRRVARTVAAAEHRYSSPPAAARMEEAFYEAMAELKFLPNSPTLMNAGTSRQQLAACFVLPIEDNMESILGTVRDMALIHQSGGGTGFNFSHLRPRLDPVRTTGGVASGPVSFMQIFNTTTEVIKQGGRRRGANMGILRYDHPDILDFIMAKATPGAFTHFNLSVAVSDEFMEKVETDDTYPLINPRTGRTVKTLPAREVFETICQQALETGDPGLIFLDAINRANPLPDLGQLEATNPCGEQPLLPYEACNLGSINLARLEQGGDVDWPELDRLVRLGVTFLDDVIDQSHYPLPQIDALTRANRKIGLGVMGLADLFIRLGLPYDDPGALKLAGQLMARIQATAVAQSEQLAQERGPFPNFSRSRWHHEGKPGRRHATLTTIAPTGTISLIAGTSSGIEPLFAIAYMRRALEGEEFLQVHPLFIQKLREAGLDPDKWLPKISPVGRVRPFTDLPASLRRLFPTTFEVTPEIQLQMQAAFQRHVDNAVSKTINLPPSATAAEAAHSFQLAYRLGLKGVTIYRYGARPGQVLSLPPEPLTLSSEFSEECRLCSV